MYVAQAQESVIVVSENDLKQVRCNYETIPPWFWKDMLRDESIEEQ